MREAAGVVVDPLLPEPPSDEWSPADWAAWDQADWEAAVESMAAAGPWPVGDASDAAAGAADAGWPPPGLLDEVQPGPLLASLAAETDLGSCSDADLVGVVRAAYRLQSWAAALEVEATNALVDRCRSWRGVVPAGEQVSSESVSAQLMAAVEVGCALDLAATARGRVAFAGDLARLPATRRALAAGVLDVPKARLVVDELRPLDDVDAQAIEQRVVTVAAGQTRGQLAGRLRRAVLAIDPTAAERRQERATVERRVELFPSRTGWPG
jgi:hypothetical protein